MKKVGHDWVENARGLATGVKDWGDWLRREDKFVDPYLVWADISGRAGGVDKWPLIVELSKEGLATCASTDPKNPACVEVPWIFAIMDVPQAYKRPAGEETFTIDGKYVTAQIFPADVIHLMCSEHVARAQLGIPRIFTPEPGAVVHGDVQATAGTPPRVVVGVIDDGFGFAHGRLLDHEGRPRVRYLWDQDTQRESSGPARYWRRPADLGYGAEMGPIAIDKLVFEASGDPWVAYRESGYGRYRLDPDTHSTAPIDVLGRPLPLTAMVATTHGHSVVDMAAGFPALHRGQLAPLAAAQASAPRKYETAYSEVETSLAAAPTDPVFDRIASIDSADQWDLVLVQLPVRTVADTSGGSLAVHVLDGIRYIVERAWRLPYVGEARYSLEPKHKSNPIIINVSYGAMGGGHDGSSILEEAIREFVKAQVVPVWVVLAAGNSHRAATHTSVEMMSSEQRQLFWRVGPDNPLESYLEIWLPDRDVMGSSFDASLSAQISVQVTAPDGRQLPNAVVGQVWQLPDAGREEGGLPAAALIYSRKVAQGKNGTMILLATAPTRIGIAPSTVGLHGEWIVTLSWGSETQTPTGPRAAIHAWTERNDLVFGVRRGQQSQVISDDPVGEVSERDPEVQAAWKVGKRIPLELRPPYGLRPGYSLSSIATLTPARDALSTNKLGRGETVVVSAYRLVDDEMSRISSGGPSRLTSLAQQWDALLNGGTDGDMGLAGERARVRPDAMAPGDVSMAVPGLRTSSLHSSHAVRISGTSAAAAWVTRGIANVQFLESKPGFPMEKVHSKAVELIFDPGPAAADLPTESARATLTPRADDAFRKAKTRAR